MFTLLIFVILLGFTQNLYFCCSELCLYGSVSACRGINGSLTGQYLQYLLFTLVFLLQMPVAYSVDGDTSCKVAGCYLEMYCMLLYHRLEWLWETDGDRGGGSSPCSAVFCHVRVAQTQDMFSYTFLLQQG